MVCNTGGSVDQDEKTPLGTVRSRSTRLAEAFLHVSKYGLPFFDTEVQFSVVLELLVVC